MSTITPEIIETEKAKTARLKRESAARSREYRQRQKAAKAPDVRTADAALVEALSFVMAKHAPLLRAQRADTSLEQASIPVLEINRTALAILVHAGYNKVKSRNLLADRTASRPEHRDPRNVPSLKPVSDPARVYSQRLWPGDPIPPVIPYRREITSADILRGLLSTGFADDDDDDA